MEDKPEKTGISFGFSKKSETKRLKLTDESGTDVNKDGPDFVSSLENQEVKRYLRMK